MPRAAQPPVTAAVSTTRHAVPRVRGPVLGAPPWRLAGLLAGALALAALAALSLALGTAELDLASVIGAFTAFDGSGAHLIVTELRVPRTLVGIMVGAALGLSGALMQGMTGNPLAEPGLLGVNGGASLAVVLGIAFGAGSVGDYVWFALIGAAVASAVVHALGAVGRGKGSDVRLALAGAVVAALFQSVTAAILVRDSATLDRFRFWDVGSIAGRGYDDVLTVAPFILVGAGIALGTGRALNALALGDDLAKALGQRVTVVRGVGSLAVVLLAGASVAAAGPIAFAGLAVPHVARLLVGADYRWILAYSLLLGPALLLAADIDRPDRGPAI